MANSSSKGSGGKDASREFSIESSKITDDSPPSAALWGTFRGLKENMAGAFYAEIAPGKNDFEKFGLALFSDFSNLQDFNLTTSPIAFRNKVEKRFGPHGELKKSDMNMAYGTFENFLLDPSKKDELLNWLRENNRENIIDFFDQLITNIIRKGKIKFNISGMLFTPGELEPEKSKAKEKKKKKQRRESSEEQHSYHRLSIVTIPLKGVSPGELQPGDEIYVRAMGKIASKFPDSLQSEKYDDTTVPLEATVESITMQPQLPADHDGNPEDYIEIKVRLENNLYGRGFVYKDETVKTVHEPEDDDSDIMIIVGIFIASGVALMLLTLAAWMIFG